MPERTRRPPVCLSIAGSDSGGGAGIQADLKAFAACGAHGTTALTALTAQSTVAVDGVLGVPAEFIVAQVRSVVEDLGVDAVKIGMLGGVDTIAAVATALRLLPRGVPVVVDPVMGAESGAELLDAGAVGVLAEQLISRATVVTPNVPEARVLAALTVGADAAERLRPEALARAVLELGPRAVVVTGGHRDEATDVLLQADSPQGPADPVLLRGVRHPGRDAHGSGCTHSSALAAHLAHGFDLETAARRAKAVAADAVARGLAGVGRGPGPVDVLDVLARRPRPPVDGPAASAPTADREVT